MQAAAGKLESKIYSAATLSGYPVRGQNRQDLGCIEELMLTPCTGRIAYAILSLSGLLDLRGKLVPVPWSALSLDSEQRAFILEVDNELLANAPAFHEEQWPDLGDQDWGNSIHHYYGMRPYWEAA
jgi:hypothetical protein